MFRLFRNKSLTKPRRTAPYLEQMEQRELLSNLYGPVSLPPHPVVPQPIIVHPVPPTQPPAPPPVSPPA